MFDRAGLAVALTLLVACGGGGGGGSSPPEPGGGATLTLSADPGAISVHGVADLAAVARNADGSPQEGVSIAFSTDHGRLDRTAAVTDAAGRATARLFGDGAAGTASVTARLGSTGVTARVEVVVGIGVFVELRADPPAISPDGEATVTATVLRDGESAVAGVEVVFSTNRGFLTATRLRTDRLGTASTTLAAQGESGVAEVTARVAEAERPATVNVAIGEGVVLELSARPAAIDTDGSATVTVGARGLDGSVVAGLRLELSTTLGRLTDTRPRTGQLGTASSTLQADGRAGVARVTASATGAEPVTLPVEIGGSATLSVSASPARIGTSGVSTVTAVASKGDGTPVSAGTSLRFTTDLGRLDADRVATDSLGSASTTLRAQGTEGTATVTVSIPGLEVAATVEVVISDG